jgi:hypothetical protein
LGYLPTSSQLQPRKRSKRNQPRKSQSRGLRNCETAAEQPVEQGIAHPAWHHIQTNTLRCEGAIDIVDGGAAEAAGLEVNNIIRSINGRSVSRIRLADLRDQWAKEPNGTRITLGIKRGNVKLKKTLHLKSLV